MTCSPLERPDATLTRRALLRQTAGLGLASITGGLTPRVQAQAPPAATAQGRPNVLFIAIDDLRPELACYGETHMYTPHLDALAGDGLRFDRCYCQMALCSPSRTSLLTGCRPDTTGVHDLRTHFIDTMDAVTPLPQHFRNHGYTTAGVGKIYHGPKHQHEPSWDAWLGDNLPPRYANPKTQAQWVEMIRAAKREGRRIPQGPVSFEAEDFPDDNYSDAKKAIVACKAMDGFAATGNPFFMAVGFYLPHLPFVAPKRYWDLYSFDEIDFPETYNPWLPTDEEVPTWARNAWSGELGGYADRPSGRVFPEEYARRLIHGYRACVSFVDAQVGRLIQHIDNLGLADDTIVVVWGDHGWHLGDHGMFCKHTNFEVATRSPLIVKVPGRTSGQSTAALSEFVDIYPSLCELCGLDTPTDMTLEGQSFVPLIDNPDRPWKSAAFSQYRMKTHDGELVMGRTMRTDRYRYTEWQYEDRPGNALRECYDHEADPNETKNIAFRAPDAPVLSELSAQLAAGWTAARVPI